MRLIHIISILLLIVGLPMLIYEFYTFPNLSPMLIILGLILSAGGISLWVYSITLGKLHSEFAEAQKRYVDKHPEKKISGKKRAIILLLSIPFGLGLYFVSQKFNINFNILVFIAIPIIAVYMVLATKYLKSKT